MLDEIDSDKEQLQEDLSFYRTSCYVLCGVIAGLICLWLLTR